MRSPPETQLGKGVHPLVLEEIARSETAYGALRLNIASDMAAAPFPQLA